MGKAGIKSVSFYSNILMLLTSIHHIYGAIIYKTPWRLHVLMISIPVIFVTLLAERYLLKNQAGKQGVVFWIYWLVILVPSICLIGLFEGVYNHLMKDVVFYIGLDTETLLQMFPPPKYEMPNDLIFEATGIAQAIVVMILIGFFIKFTRNVLREN